MSASALAVPVPKSRRSVFERLDDAMNPIVVKELRQAVLSRFVVAVLLIFLMLQLLLIGVRLLLFGYRAEVDSIDFQAGREMFAYQQGILLFTCMVFLPLYTGIRLAAERNDTNTDLLYVTTIKPGSIIFGKMLSAVVLAILILSACMPFMALTYYLRGIDWPSIVIVIGIDLLVVMASVQAMVFLAVIPCSRVFKAMLAIGALIALCYTFAGTLAGTVELTRAPISSWLREPGFWLAAAAFVFMMFAICGVLYTWSIALLAAPSANRALPVRVFALLLWGASLGLMVAAMAYTAPGMMPPLAPLIAWAVIMTMFACLNLAIAIGERRNFSIRLTRTIPRLGLFRRVAFLFYSGAGGGIMFATLLMAMTAAATLAVFVWSGRGVRIRHAVLDLDEEIYPLLAGCAISFLYTFAYALTAVFLRSHVFRRLPTPTTPLIAIILLGVGSALPWFIGSMIYLQSWRFDDQHYWLLANPFMAFNEVTSLHRFGSHSHKAIDYGIFAGAWALLAMLVNVPWMFGQFRRFRRPELPTPSPALELIPALPIPAAEPLPAVDPTAIVESRHG